MRNINRDYLIVVDTKSATVSTPSNMNFCITDIKTSNIFAELVVNESKSELVKKYTPVENASDFSITLRVIKPNNEPKEVQFMLVDELEAYFMVDLTEDFKDYIDDYRCELFVDCKVNGELERITTSEFSYTVTGSIMNDLDEVIEGDPDYPVVEGLIATMEENIKSANEIMENANNKIDETITNTNNRIDETINNTNNAIQENIANTNSRVDEVINESNFWREELKDIDSLLNAIIGSEE